VGRPPNTDPAVTRNRILQAAIDLFGENGREGAAIREVARRAEVSMSTVLHHFGSKQGLFDACIEKMFGYLAEHSETMFSLAREFDRPTEATDAIVRRCFRFAREHARLLRVITCESVTSGRTPETVRDELAIATLDRAADVVTALGDWSQAQARVKVLSICHIITRFVLTDPLELRDSLRLDTNGDPDAVYDILENQVARNAALLLWGQLN